MRAVMESTSAPAGDWPVQLNHHQPPRQHDINHQFGREPRMILKRIVQLVGARTLFNGYFSALARPPPNYEGHIPLNPPERAILAVGSAIGALLNPRRGGKPP